MILCKSRLNGMKKENLQLKCACFVTCHRLCWQITNANCSTKTKIKGRLYVMFCGDIAQTKSISA